MLDEGRSGCLNRIPTMNTDLGGPAFGSRVLIPHIFHQIWLEPHPFPSDYQRRQASWLRQHPRWELRVWTDKNLPRELRRVEAAERLRSPLERSDILRLEVLWRFG